MKQRRNEGSQHALWSAVERNRRLDFGEKQKKQAKKLSEAILIKFKVYGFMSIL